MKTKERQHCYYCQGRLDDDWHTGPDGWPTICPRVVAEDGVMLHAIPGSGYGEELESVLEFELPEDAIGEE